MDGIPAHILRFIFAGYGENNIPPGTTGTVPRPGGPLLNHGNRAGASTPPDFY
ncbi:hypothetical protein OBV_37620 [Oscillibacter valericigenes Sjm18-20]|nr:hypothetical protein OBV_37620 [Oscillibacter valericigenes Sjm18-20]